MGPFFYKLGAWTYRPGYLKAYEIPCKSYEQVKFKHLTYVAGQIRNSLHLAPKLKIPNV